MDDDKALMLLKDFEALASNRGTRDRVFQSIRELVRPSTTDFIGTTTSGTTRTGNAYDSTAINACKQLAAGLHSYLTNPAERWFSLTVKGVSANEYDEEAIAWLEVVADTIYGEYNRPGSGFNACMHECFLDIGAFGTSNPYQAYSKKDGCLEFRSFPIADSFFRESSRGLIDTVFRRVRWTRRQLGQEFERLPEKLSQEKRMDKEFTIIHATYPREGASFGGAATNKPIASVWICQDTKEVIEESGFEELPYHPGRWEKLAGEVYGEGPAGTCLPDILMLNAMERTLIRAGQKQVDPPLMIPDEGYTLPIATAPGSILWREPGTDPVEALRFEGNLPWGEDKAEQKRRSIEICFHADWLRMEKENKEMTAFEVSDRRNEKLGLLAPNLGRIQSEQLGPMLQRTYRLLHDNDYFPPAPLSLQRKRLKVDYISPAARAQLAIKANEASRYAQEMLTIAAVKPEILDYIDFDMLARKLAEYRSITTSILRAKEDVDRVREGRKEQEQMMQLAAMAEPATKAMKNVADAQAKGLQI